MHNGSKQNSHCRCVAYRAPSLPHFHTYWDHPLHHSSLLNGRHDLHLSQLQESRERSSTGILVQSTAPVSKPLH